MQPAAYNVAAVDKNIVSQRHKLFINTFDSLHLIKPVADILYNFNLGTHSFIVWVNKLKRKRQHLTLGAQH